MMKLKPFTEEDLLEAGDIYLSDSDKGLLAETILCKIDDVKSAVEWLKLEMRNAKDIGFLPLPNDLTTMNRIDMIIDKAFRGVK